MTLQDVCNFCMLRSVRKHAQIAGHVVTVLPSPQRYAPDGIDVFSHPKDASEKDIGNWWCCWLAKTPTRCVCQGEK